MLRKNRGLINSYHASKLPIKGDATEIVTRQTFDVSLQTHKALSKINSLNYKVGSSWNTLPFTIKSDVHYSGLSIRTFAKRIKHHFVSNYRIECTIKKCYACKRK